MKSPAINRVRRHEIECRIEAMIALLDLLDGDPDLEEGGDDEPSIGGQALQVGKRVENDLEFETDDYEQEAGS